MPKFCPNCGEEISDKVKFCPKCGADIDSFSVKKDEKSTIEETKKAIKIEDTKIEGKKSESTESDILTHKPNKLFYLGICIFLIVILFIVAPTKTITNDIEVVYTDNQTYYEKEPYEIQEAYQEQIPYQTTETYTDSVPVPVSVPYQTYETSYQNYDAGTGKYYLTIPSGCTCSSNRFMSDQNGIYGSLCVQLSCLISTPVTKYRIEYSQQSVQKERPVTKYQTTTKYRNVTQYRDVLKTREVMKTRIDQKQLEENWLLGFKTPYKLHLPIISGA